MNGKQRFSLYNKNYCLQVPPDLQSGLMPGTKRRPTPNEPFDESVLIAQATEAFVRELGLGDASLISDGKVEIREVPAGTYLMKEESHKVN